MSKRQRFFVELKRNEATVISWKQLLEDHAAASERSPINAATPIIDFPAKTTTTMSTTATPAAGNSQLQATKLKVLKLPTVVSYYRKRKPTSMMKQSVEEDGSLENVVVMAKGKVHRSMPAKTSCRTKKTKACFCCPAKNDQTS